MSFILNTNTGKMKEIKTEVYWIRSEIIATRFTDKYKNSLEKKFNDFLFSVLKENLADLKISFGPRSTRQGETFQFVILKSIRNFSNKNGIISFEYPVEIGNYANFVEKGRILIDFKVNNELKMTVGNSINVPVLIAKLNYELVNSKIDSSIFADRPKEIKEVEISKFIND